MHERKVMGCRKSKINRGTLSLKMQKSKKNFKDEWKNNM
jgi:hypothetical protein